MPTSGVALRTPSRIASAVSAAATTPMINGLTGPAAFEESVKTTSPSAAEWTGSTARAIPALAILATMPHSVFVSAASVTRQTSVVLPTGGGLRNGGASN